VSLANLAIFANLAIYKVIKNGRGKVKNGLVRK